MLVLFIYKMYLDLFYINYFKLKREIKRILITDIIKFIIIKQNKNYTIP